MTAKTGNKASAMVWYAEPCVKYSRSAVPLKICPCCQECAFQPHFNHEAYSIVLTPRLVAENETSRLTASIVSVRQQTCTSQAGLNQHTAISHHYDRECSQHAPGAYMSLDYAMTASIMQIQHGQLTLFSSGPALHKGVVERPLPAGCHGIWPSTSRESPMRGATPELGRMRGFSPAFRSRSKICPFSFFVSVSAICA